MPATLYEPITLLASAARTTSSAGSAVALLDPARRVAAKIDAVALILDVTVDEQTSGDKLDVTVQVMLDNTNWHDVCAFTQHLGNAGAARYVAKITAAAAQAMFTNAALTAGNIRNLLGTSWRVSYTVTDGSTNASFTFAVYAVLM